MSTRCNIGIENRDGSVEMVYCHFDGYPSHNGAILTDHYTTEDSVRELIAHGDMSVLGEGIDTSVFYGRDRGETDVGAFLYPNRESAMADMEEYLYLFHPDTGWHTYTPPDVRTIGNL